jgi:hypothetical protein
MGMIGGHIAGSVCQTFNITSGSSSSSSSSNKTERSGEGKEIGSFTKEELEDKIKYIHSIKVPSSNNKGLSEIGNVFGVLLTGSEFAHEGLIIETKGNKYYVCQTYPIEFKKVDNYDKGKERIKYYWKINKNAEDVKEYTFGVSSTFTIEEVKTAIENMMDYYNVFTYNCQHFCKIIIKKFVH